MTYFGGFSSINWSFIDSWNFLHLQFITYMYYKFLQYMFMNVLFASQNKSASKGFNKQTTSCTNIRSCIGNITCKRNSNYREIASPRGTSRSALPTAKTKGDLNGKSILHICCKLFNMLLGSNVLQWCIKFYELC